LNRVDLPTLGLPTIATTGFDIFMTARQTAFADTASFQSFGIIISSIYAYKNQKGREGSSSSTSPHS
jgi:hypothetical protein